VRLARGEIFARLWEARAAVGALNAAAFGPMEGKISPDTVQELIGRGSAEGDVTRR